MSRLRRACVPIVLVFLALVWQPLAARPISAVRRTTPTVRLVPAPDLTFPADTDSNSPAVWMADEDGEPMLHLFNSVAGATWRSVGASLADLGQSRPAVYTDTTDGGRWMEAVVADDDGALYGYYHNESGSGCDDRDLTVPRIGAARSVDGGLTWDDLGILLEAPRELVDCTTSNRYVAGGLGDLSVMLDVDRTHLYVFFSVYTGAPSEQGVSVARLAWADRDEPRGRLAVWRDSEWLPADVQADDTLAYPGQTPIFPAALAWHDPSGRADAFWGPSIHWNTHLQQYVILLNRAADNAFAQEGIYVSFSPSLEAPAQWTPPRRVLTGGSWYPQIVGLPEDGGTDKLAGARARLFVGGASNSYIEFIRPAGR